MGDTAVKFVKDVVFETRIRTLSQPQTIVPMERPIPLYS